MENQLNPERIFEIEWRELLIKRLNTPRAALQRDKATEEKQITEAKQLATGYESVDEAHEAFGWGDITERQFDAIKAVFIASKFENQENKSTAALKRITRMISELQGEIKNLRGDEIQEEIHKRHAEANDGR